MKVMVAILSGPCLRIGPFLALLLLASFGVIEPLSCSHEQWQQLLETFHRHG